MIHRHAHTFGPPKIEETKTPQNVEEESESESSENENSTETLTALIR